MLAKLIAGAEGPDPSETAVLRRVLQTSFAAGRTVAPPR